MEEQLRVQTCDGFPTAKRGSTVSGRSTVEIVVDESFLSFEASPAPTLDEVGVAASSEIIFATKWFL